MDSWLKRDLKYIWHPYTQMKDCLKLPPILIERAKGVKLYDSEGNFYYDTISSWWCNVHGHNHPYIKAALKKQLELLEHVLFAGFTHKPAIRLAERLIEIAPSGLTKVFFSDNGSTAVEVALKMSFQYWQNQGYPKKRRFVSLERAYHGDTLGALSVSGIDLFNRIFSALCFKSFRVKAPYCYRCPLAKDNQGCSIECIGPLEKLLKEKSETIAAIILEPMLMAAGGMLVYPSLYLLRVAALAKKFNVHLICDEVATGLGRTGKMFACEHAKISPDFLCLSKGITSGYLPQGVTLTTDKVYQAFYADYYKYKTFYHGHTYTANPLACACALASLEVFQKEKTLKNIKTTIPIFKSWLERFRGLEYVGDVRSLGLVGALELVKNKKTKEGFSAKQRIGFRLYKEGLKKGLVLRPLGDIIYFFLPLCIRKEELEDIMERAYAVIKFIR